MPIAMSPERPRTRITKFTGGLLVRGNELVKEDLWISSDTGKILHGQEAFYEHHITPDEVIDLNGKILAPGFIDVQFNGGFGFDFSTVPDDMTEYRKGLNELNRKLVRTGVTSYLPTLPSQKAEVYHKTLKYLGPSGGSRNPLLGAESLGAHCEGPFIAGTKCGIHSPSVLRNAPNGLSDIDTCYGPENLSFQEDDARSPITMITLAPELPGLMSAIPALTSRGIRVSVGHTEATYSQTTLALQFGATMLTHLFNAMRPLHHRDPGPFGTLGSTSPTVSRPYFGIIADGIHLHPTTVNLAYNAHPSGFILVTDAMKTMGLPDGAYDWTNGDKWVKKGALLTRQGTDTLAGSSATLVECASNFWNWSGASVPEVIRAVTAAPAGMLGLDGVKGCLEAGADADLVVLDAVESGKGEKRIEVEQVWKFGVNVYDREAEEIAKLKER
ncbi:N-acetyl-glucosamine-6-phosphate deacetylase [Oleoguttula sp. CCFEE 5521]